VTRLFAVALLALAAGCDHRVPLPNEALPTVEYWPEQQLLFLASPRSGQIDVLRVPSSPRQGSLDFVERLSNVARHEVVRLAVDRATGRLWVADRRAIYIYQIVPRGTAKEIRLGGQNEAPVTDFVLDSRGNGYVFVAAGAQIHRIASDNLRAEKWLETAYASARSTVPSGNRSLLTKDGREILFQSPKDGALIRVDLATKNLSKVKRHSPIALDCAVLLWNDDRTRNEGQRSADAFSVSAFQCAGRWVGQLDFDTTLSVSKERYLSSTK